MRKLSLLVVILTAVCAGAVAQTLGTDLDNDPFSLNPATPPGGLPSWNDPNLSTPTKRPPTDDEIRRNLKSYGYYELGELQRQGSQVTVTARRDGKAVTVQLNLDTGSLTEGSS